MKIHTASILNRDGSIPADGWHQIEVKGTWPAGTFPDGKPRKQLIDDKAIESILNRFQEEKAAAGEDFPGMLVDVDHLSHDPEQTTEAYAWLQDLQIRNGQLHGKLDLTDLGEPAVRNKRLKFFSTEYDPADLEPAGDGIVRPLRLAGLAFTNRPNNRGGKPISNRQEPGGPGGEPTPNDDTTPTMKSIAEKLGLSADADEPAILNAITQLQSKVKDGEAKENERQADEILNTIGKNIPKDALPHWREQLITNRETAKKSIELSFPAEVKRGDERVFNRNNARTPENVEKRENADDAAADAEANRRASAIRNRAHSISKERGIPYNQAFDLASAEQS
jgi:hypothetical protein